MYKVKSKRSKKVKKQKKSKRKSNKKITDLLVSFFPSVLSLLIFNWLFINKNKKNAHTISYIQFFYRFFFRCADSPSLLYFTVDILLIYGEELDAVCATFDVDIMSIILLTNKLTFRYV